MRLPEALHRNFREHEGNVFLRHLREHCGLDGGGRDAVYRNRGLGEFLSERLRQTDDAGFSGAVGSSVRVAFFSGHRSNVDDAAVICSAHLRYDRTTDEKRSGEIDIDHRPPRVDRILPGRRVRSGDTGTIHQDIDSPELRDRFTCGAFYRRGVGNVERDGRSDVARLGGVTIPHAYARTTALQELDNRSTNTACTAGDDRNPIGEALVHAPISASAGHRPEASNAETTARVDGDLLSV